MEPIATPTAPETRRAKFEIRPSPLREWNADAPDEIVFVDGRKRGFGDLLQAFNPLHHLPVVGTLYREMTGTTIEPAARVIGGLIFGGPIGVASAIANAFLEESSGKDIGGHIASLVKPAGSDPDAPPPPPGSRPAGPVEGGLFLASMNATPIGTTDGTTESDGLLTTWIAAGAPRPEPILEARATAQEPARAMPTHLPLFTPLPPAAVAAVSPEVPVAAPAVASPAAPPPAMPEALPLSGRGRSLAEYRAAAQAIPTGTMRTPVPSDPLAFQRNAPRMLASYRAEAPAAAPATAQAAPAVPAAIEAQRQIDPAQAATPEQSWVAAMMAAGLDRYRDTQRRRDAARPENERL